jgi:hypothetical protein
MQTSYLSRNRIDAILGQKSLAHESGYSERVGSVAFFRKIELSLQSRARFADLIVQKCSVTVRLFTFSTANRTLARSCALFLESFSRSRPGRAETQTLLSRPHTRKDSEFRARKEVIYTRTVTRIYCSHLRTAIATFVVDMMARLTTDIRP